MKSIWQKLFQWLLVLEIVCTQGSAKNCIDSSARSGKCVHITQCPALRKIATKPVVSKQERDFLSSNFCGKAMERSFRRVCCEKPVAFPGLDICGFDDAEVKIRGGNQTERGQYRWMVAIERIFEDVGRKFICGGSLINTLYVLTAAHCVPNVVDHTKLLVRLGEFDMLTDPDCDEDNNCNDPVKIVGVSKTIFHRKYGRNQNDIALLKLAKALPNEYTDYIVPICLPTAELVGQQSLTNKEVWAAGWGNNGTGEDMSRYKLHVQLVVVELNECSVLKIRSEPGPMHICARSAIPGDGDTCHGDSGGPLMVNLKGNWFVIGIVGTGEACESRRPAIYTNVTYFADWILENIEE